jgi:hypothetical protein
MLLTLLWPLGTASRNHIVLRSINPRQAARAAMKRCAQCRGKLGLGVRARNLWNGRWWLRVRFCSTYCEALYELERYDGNADRWRTLLGRLTPQN